MKKYMALVAALILTGGVIPDINASDSDYRMDEVIVEGQRDHWGVEPHPLSGGYVYDAATQGFLGSKSVMDIPNQQLTLTQKAIKDFAIPGRELDSVLIMDPAVRETGQEMTDITVRGIGQNGYAFRINGIPGMLIQNNMTPTSFADHIDITAGPGMGTRGSASRSGSAGGVIDIISKVAPKDRDVLNYTQTFSGRGSFRESIDASTRLGENNTWGVRVNGAFQDGEQVVPGEKNRTKDIYVNIDHEDNRSKTNILTGYSDGHRWNQMRAFSFSRYNGTTLLKPPSIDKNYSYPDNEWGVRTFIFALNHEQKLTDHINFFANYGYAFNKGYAYSVKGSWNVLDESGTFDGGQAGSAPYALRNRFLQGGLKADFDIGAINHEITLALDTSSMDGLWNNPTPGGQSITLPGGNIYDFPDMPSGIIPKPDYGYLGSTNSYGISAVDTMTYGKWILSAGVHHHRLSYGEFGGDRVVSDATSPLLGLVYKANEHLMAYGNHSEFFDKGTFLDEDDYINPGILPPAKTKQNELGIKYMKDGLLTTLSIFDIRTERIFTYDLGREDGKKLSVLDGWYNYRGVEWSFNGKVSPKWNVIGGVSYLTTEQKSQDFYNGKAMDGIPRWNAVLGLIYKPNEDISLIGRVKYVGGTSFYTNKHISIDVPSYTVWDFGAQYKTEVFDHPVTFSAMCHNAFDRAYWNFNGSTGFLSRPRTFVLSASFDF